MRSSLDMVGLITKGNLERISQEKILCNEGRVRSDP
jgi:hypothetical protein